MITLVTFALATKGTILSIETICTKDGATLSCITPAIPLSVLPSFSSYFISLGGNILALRYIVYGMYFIMNFICDKDERIISAYPRVFPKIASLSNFAVTITLDSPVPYVEGNIALLISLGSIQNYYVLYTFPTNNITYSTTIVSPTEGTYGFQLYYQNIFLFSTRNAIAFSSIQNASFLQTREITFAPGVSNLVIGNGNLTVEISGQQLDMFAIVPNVKCNLNGQDVPTTYVNGNSFICAVSSVTQGVYDLNIHYIGKDAYNGSVLLSSSPLRVVFVSMSLIFQVHSLFFSTNIYYIDKPIYNFNANRKCHNHY